jgi:hypothetical protein
VGSRIDPTLVSAKLPSNYIELLSFFTRLRSEQTKAQCYVVEHKEKSACTRLAVRCQFFVSAVG